jgi:hypothetical protein
MLRKRKNGDYQYVKKKKSPTYYEYSKFQAHLIIEKNRHFFQRYQGKSMDLVKLTSHKFRSSFQYLNVHLQPFPSFFLYSCFLVSLRRQWNNVSGQLKSVLWRYNIMSVATVRINVFKIIISSVINPLDAKPFSRISAKGFFQICLRIRRTEINLGSFDSLFLLWGVYCNVKLHTRV